MYRCQRLRRLDSLRPGFWRSFPALGRHTDTRVGRSEKRVLNNAASRARPHILFQSRRNILIARRRIISDSRVRLAGAKRNNVTTRHPRESMWKSAMFRERRLLESHDCSASDGERLEMNAEWLCLSFADCFGVVARRAIFRHWVIAYPAAERFTFATRVSVMSLLLTSNISSGFRRAH